MERTYRGHIVNYNAQIAEALIESAFARTDHGACKRELQEERYCSAHYEAECVRLAGIVTFYRRRACQWKSAAIAPALVVACMAAARWWA